MAVDSNGIILQIFQDRTVPELVEGSGEIEEYKGIICPGFINTHCHLELSWLKGKIPMNTGLDGFLREFMLTAPTQPPPKGGGDSRRGIQDEVTDAIKRAILEMKTNGIVACGDISNKSISFEQKDKSELFFHTFIELYGFDPLRAQKVFQQGKDLLDQHHGIRKKASITAHAPYSVSTKLLKMIADEALQQHSILSIHNQESEDENIFFEKGEGKIRDRLEWYGIDLKDWKVPGMRSVEWLLSQLPSSIKTLLVHNTVSKKEDIQRAGEINPNLYWCFCPKANIYIENKLPDFNLFYGEDVRCTIGTDSLASNDGLSILEELKIITKTSPEIPLEILLNWACKNGAEFLGIGKQYGTLEPGKKPGILLLDGCDFQNLRLTEETKVRVLV